MSQSTRVDNLEGELEAMDLGREGGLAAEIDALREDDSLNEELEALKQSMQAEQAEDVVKKEEA